MRRELPLHPGHQTARAQSHAAERLVAGSPSGLPALFSACRKAMLAAAGVALLAGSAVAVAAPGPGVEGYRLAGVIATGADRMGFLALPNGSQVLIRPGSVLPDGSRIVEFTDRVVRIARAGGGLLELALQGGGSASSPVAAAAPSAASPASAAGTVPATPPGGNPSEGIVLREKNLPTVMMRRVDARAARSAIKPRVDAAKAGRGKPGELPAVESVAVNLGPMFDLPAGSQLKTVDSQAVTSAAQVMEAVQKKLSAGMPVTMNVSDPSGRDQRVYIMPSDTRPRITAGG